MSYDTNSVILIGRLVSDANLREFDNGGYLCNFNLAFGTRGKDGATDSNFIKVCLFGNTAKSLSPYLTKGQQICVNGALKMESWEKDGVKHYSACILGSSVQLLQKPANKTESQAVGKYDKVESAMEKKGDVTFQEFVDAYSDGDLIPF